MMDMAFGLVVGEMRCDEAWCDVADRLLLGDGGIYLVAWLLNGCDGIGIRAAYQATFPIGSGLLIHVVRIAFIFKSSSMSCCRQASVTNTRSCWWLLSYRSMY